jgi:hypothetical protein
MAYQQVVEALGENLASSLELLKKWLGWFGNFKRLLDCFHQLRKEDLVGLVNGTHKIVRVKEDKRDGFSILDGTIIRNIKPNRTFFGKQAVNATGRKKHVNDEVVDDMPSGTEGEMEVHLVLLKRYVLAPNLEEELATLGYEMIDPIAACALNEVEPELADKYPNGVQWKDASGKFCYAIFDRNGLSGGRNVRVDRHDNNWSDSWFFPCVRISS